MTTCTATGKEMFPTAAGAYKRVKQLSKRRRDRHDDKFVHGPLSAYRCKHCHQFHCGHKSAPAPTRRHLMEARA